MIGNAKSTDIQCLPPESALQLRYTGYLNISFLLIFYFLFLFLQKEFQIPFFIDVYAKTGNAQISNTPMNLTAASGNSIPAILQTAQISVIAEIVRRLKPHKRVFFKPVFFLSIIYLCKLQFLLCCTNKKYTNKKGFSIRKHNKNPHLLSTNLLFYCVLNCFLVLLIKTEHKN